MGDRYLSRISRQTLVCELEMTAQNAREQLINAYPQSKRWAARVNQMNDTQVFAILMRFKQEK